MAPPANEKPSPTCSHAIQASLQPNQAVQVLGDRVKRISKLNTEIADWLQVRPNTSPLLLLPKETSENKLRLREPEEPNLDTGATQSRGTVCPVLKAAGPVSRTECAIRTWVCHQAIS